MITTKYHGQNITPGDEYCLITDFSLKLIYTSGMYE
jgi:hypothetical protein